MLLILLNYLNGVADPTRDLVVLGCAGWGVVQTQTGMQHEDVLLRHGTVIAQLINSPVGHNNFPLSGMCTAMDACLSQDGSSKYVHSELMVF